MSNPLAIATVTACLQRSLQEAINSAPIGSVPGAAVKAAKPPAPGGAPSTPTVYLFLYQTTPNSSLRNADLPTRDSNANLRQRPRAAIDLHYLLSFWGDETTLEPQRMLGVVEAWLHANSVLSRQVITQTILDPIYNPILQNADLAEAIETIRFTPTVLSLEELSKLWSVFFQTTYALSVAYQASVVLVEFGKLPPSPQPVLERGIYALPMDVPVISTVAPQVATAGATITLRGSGFVRGQTTVVIGNEPPIAPTILEASRIELPLPATLRAGVHSVTVVVDRVVTAPGGGSRTFPISSTPVALVLAPSITGGPAFSVSAGGTLNLAISPPVLRKQATRLLVGESTLVGPKLVAPPNEDTTIGFSVPVGFAPGTYPLRVEVAGIASQIRPDAASPSYAPSLKVT